MNKDNKHIKRAVVLFSLSPGKEAQSKKITNNLQTNSVLLKSLFDNTVDMLQLARRQTGFDLIISSSDNKLSGKFLTIKQRGNSFDDRLKNIISDVFANNYDEVVVVGNDCPDLTPALIQQAFDHLNSKNAVIGPSADGGFYLLGLKQNDENIFNNIEWFSSKVFNQVTDNLQQARFSFTTLPKLNDIDSFNDLVEWVSKCETENLLFCLILKNILSTYILFVSIYSVTFIPIESYRRIWQKPPPVI